MIVSNEPRPGIGQKVGSRVSKALGRTVMPGSKDSSPQYGHVSGILAVSVLLGLMIAGLSAASQQLQMPENPLRGRFVFEQKGCSTCHAVSGAGGGIGPDLGQKKFYGSYMELASVMWNHSPLMLRRMHELELPYPRLSSKEMNELIAYLYYQRFLGDPGDMYRGKFLVGGKGCLNCHSVGGRGGSSAPPFDQLARFASPLYMAQALWNHGPAMEKALALKGLQRPRFQPGEIVDLSAYIRGATAANTQDRVYMAPGNPARGRTILEEKQCLSCHALNGQGGTAAIDFGATRWDLSVSEIAALMWNHGSEMEGLMSERRIAWPQFRGNEMADLISFLYFLGFQDKPGDPASGRRLFGEKGCVTCHSSGGTSPAGPLTKRLASPTDLAAVLWNHAPAMEHKAAERAVSWPQLSGSELADLSAFIQSHPQSGAGP